MSKTIRRKQGHGWCYGDYTIKDALEEWRWDSEIRWSVTIHHDPKSKEGKRRIAQYHSDAKSVTKNGPATFITMYQRRYRRSAKQELFKFVRNDEYEVQILDKPLLDYWW